MGYGAVATAAAAAFGSMVGVAAASTIAVVVGGVVAGAIYGAAIGALTAALTGGDIGKGILFGMVGGAVTGGISGYLGAAGSISNATTAAGMGDSTISGYQASQASLPAGSYSPGKTSGDSSSWFSSSTKGGGGLLDGAAGPIGQGLSGLVGNVLSSSAQEDALEKATKTKLDADAKQQEANRELQRELQRIQAGTAESNMDKQLEVQRYGIDKQFQTAAEQRALQSSEYNIARQREDQMQDRKVTAATALNVGNRQRQLTLRGGVPVDSIDKQVEKAAGGVPMRPEESVA